MLLAWLCAVWPAFLRRPPRAAVMASQRVGTGRPGRPQTTQSAARGRGRSATRSTVGQTELSHLLQSVWPKVSALTDSPANKSKLALIPTYLVV